MESQHDEEALLCLAQLGSQEWVMKRAVPPFSVASVHSFGLHPATTI